jgi:5-formyltetrahydrofolate cyclo-ligase
VQPDRAATEHAKQAIRERIWRLLDQQGACPPPGAAGRIPNFVGADAAAERLARLPAWRAAAVVKANPDKAQLPVRARALAEGKLVYMAVPNLAEERPFFLLDPERLSVPPAEAASSKVAPNVARTVAVDELRPVDLAICGSVAVNRDGARIGKGAGYSDLEVALLIQAGLLPAEALIVSTVHPLQVVGEKLPETEHDFRVDVIVTPDEVIACGPPRRPPGVMWEQLDAAKIAAIPALANLVARRQ